jgi:hypothetical protein
MNEFKFVNHLMLLHHIIRRNKEYQKKKVRRCVKREMEKRDNVICGEYFCLWRKLHVQICKRKIEWRCLCVYKIFLNRVICNNRNNHIFFFKKKKNVILFEIVTKKKKKKKKKKNFN